MEKKKITIKIFWEMMKTWDVREKFLNELDDEFSLYQDIKLHFDTPKYIDSQNIESLDSNNSTFNLIVHKCLYNAVGKELFYFYIENFNQQEILLKANSRRHMRIFLERKNGKDHKTIAATYNISEANSRQIYRRLKLLYTEN